MCLSCMLHTKKRIYLSWRGKRRIEKCVKRKERGRFVCFVFFFTRSFSRSLAVSQRDDCNTGDITRCQSMKGVVVVVPRDCLI